MKPVLPLPQATSMVISMLRSGQAIWMRVHGHSMAPALNDGDTVHIEPAPAGSIPVGAVAVVVGADQRLRAHRVIAITPQGIVTAGDAVGVREGPWPPDAVLGLVVERERERDVQPVSAAHRAAARGVHSFGLPLACAAIGGLGMALMRDPIEGPFSGRLVPVVVSLGVGLWTWRSARRRDFAVMAAALAALSPTLLARSLGVSLAPLTLALLALLPLAAWVERRPALFVCTAAAAVLIAMGAPQGHFAMGGFLPLLTWPLDGWSWLGWLAVQGASAVVLAGVLARMARRRRGRIPSRPIALAAVLGAVLQALLLNG